MTVRIEKPAINVREELADLRKPTGIAGEAMLRADTPQEQQALIGVGRRNALINGGFDVWQRGTSISLAAGTLYSADRWTGYSSTTGRTHSRDTTEALSIGFKNCGKFITGSAGPSFYQKAEDVRTFAGQTVTLSFWMKSNEEHTPSWGSLQQNFGSGGSSTVTVNLPDLGMVTTEWKYFTATVTLPSVVGKTIGSNDDYLLVYMAALNGSTTYWITGVQLELGKVATPFEHRSYGEELALCQRYYYQAGGETTSQFLATGQAYSTTQFNGCVIPFPVTMRDAPEMSYASAANFKVQNSSGSGITITSLSISTGEASARSASVRGVVGSGLVAGNATMFYTANTSGILKFDAEL